MFALAIPAHPGIRLLSGVAAMALAACGHPPDTVGTSPEIRLGGGGSHATYVEVVGLPRADLDALRGRPLDADGWKALLSVRVAPAEPSNSGREGWPAMAGAHAVVGETIRFTPAFPLDPGRAYDVRFDPRQLTSERAAAWRSGAIDARVSVAARTETAPPSRVIEVSPSGSTVPENLLRLYIEFSEPMGLAGGLPYIRLKDADGREVIDPFVPLDQPLWNAARTRYTLLFDPGRVKRGILPNARMGRPLRAGRTYTLEIDAAWRDAHGRPLAEPFRRTLRVGRAILEPLDHSRWQLDAPRAGSRDAVQVRFPWALDVALLERVMGVETADGASVSGTVRAADNGTSWTLTPLNPWQPGAYQLVALTVLEDPSGNRIGRAFEIEAPATAVAAPERVTRAFTVN